MTTYFKKITNLSLPVVDPDSIKGDLLFHYGNSRYYEITDKSYHDAIANAFQMAPKEIYLAEAIGPLRPHRDNGVTSCLNYYLRPSGYTTTFWEPIENARRLGTKKYDKKTDSYIDVLLGYEKDDLIPQDSFTAEAGDVYLLNISKVHSVTNGSTEEARSFIQCQWHLNMDKLLQMIVPEL